MGACDEIGSASRECVPDDEALDDIASRWTKFGDWRGEVRMEVAAIGCLVARRQRVEICRHATMARVYVGREEEQHKSRESGEWLRDEATPRLAQVDISVIVEFVMVAHVTASEAELSNAVYSYICSTATYRVPRFQ